ncbi:translation initiation factor [Haoranjiania flava]|uniref:Translation initiation factor n=1 Tax=Haoranjiania flava TaxID=1856322 RepID=A0AAE3INK8_9BACT|nr:translation initiation factor [Haoranjiania flava]MCU7694343.1 translation initiation factor [Haoranjiania flava]
MKNKKRSSGSAFVYSTDPDFKPYGEGDDGDQDGVSPDKQKLRIWLETKQRGGKAATVITGFAGNEDELKELGKQLKNYCGTGGSVKDGEIIIQGDQRDKVLKCLLDKGYTQSKKAGG